jgi:NTE family protein
MKRSAPLLAILLAAATALSPALATPPAVGAAPGSAADAGKKRPKICLVLSGGGARGAAHVGVLKVLEEYRVPVDCIAGTSMGALIGAGYATGTTIAELEETSHQITTELLFKEKPPREEIDMRRKIDDYKPYFGPEIGLKEGFRLPKGVVSGVQLETVLRRLSKAKGYHRFDELPIPFRAVATDLVTGQAVVFHDGELANVMRASMSVPGAVAPAEFGGMMLVDGMLTSNLPVETAQAMGADIIIAVNVGTPLLTREQLGSILGVTGQMLSILTEQNVQASLAKLKPSDILISPELGKYSTGDFDHLPDIVPLGEAAARRAAERLAQLSLPAEEYAALRRRQSVTVASDLRPVDEIRFDKLARVNPKNAQAVMETKPGQPIDQAVLDADMRRIYGTGDFEHVNYSFIEEQGRRILAVDAVEKTWGPDYLRFGLGLSSDFGNDAYYNILASYRKTWINSLGAEWRTDFQIGRTSSLYSEFYQPLNVGRFAFFVAPRIGLERRAFDLYQGNTRVATYDVASGWAGADLGVNFRQYGTLRLGVNAGRTEANLDTGPTWLATGKTQRDRGAYTGLLTIDRMDNISFPREGWRGRIYAYGSKKQLGADDEYNKWDVDAISAHSFGEHTLNFGLKAGGKAGANPLPAYDQYQWGGFTQQSGYATGQLYGESIRFGRAIYYRRIMRGSLLDGAYAGLSYEVGKVAKPVVPGNPDGVLRSASAFVAADTPLGPVYVGYGHAQDGNSSWYFFLGRPF